MGLLVIGIAGAEAWKSENVIAMREGESTAFAGYSIAMQTVNRTTGPGYQSQRAIFAVSRGTGGSSWPLAAELRFFPARQMQTTEAAIQSDLLGNLYVSIGEPDELGAGPSGSISTR